MERMRQEIPDKYNIKELQDKILQIAVYIDSLCEKHGIKYYLMGGSALGALRHSGFIPWDDDLDIFMYPEDYQKFKTVFFNSGDQENYYLQQLSECDGRILSAKLRLNNTTYIEEATREWKIHQGIFVDIFLLHNAPKNNLLRLMQCFSAKLVLAKGQKEKGVRYTGIKRLFSTVAGCLPRRTVLKNGLRGLYRYDRRDTQYVCHFVGKAFFQKGIYEKSVFGTPQRIKFENVYLNIPEKADRYLTERFGDYRKPPSEDRIKWEQHASTWDTERDFSEYTNSDRNFCDENKLV